MVVQGVTRKNCVGVSYITSGWQHWHFKFIIEDTLCVPDDLVDGIDTRGDFRWLFQVSNDDCYKYICDEFSGREIRINSNCVVKIDDISHPGTRIELTQVPFSLTNDQLSGMMGKFGIVHKCQNYYREFGKYKKLKKTGDRVVYMSILKHVPQSLNISRTDMTVYANYNKQPMCCNTCGHIGHRERFCRHNPSNYINVIDIINDSKN